MKKQFCLLFILLLLLTGPVTAQRILSLDSCRALAVKNNKKLLIGDDNIEAAEYEHKAAKTKFLPKLTADASYIYNARTTHLLSKDQRNTLKNLGTLSGTKFQQTAASIAQQFPELAPLLQSLGTATVPALNNLGSTINRAFETDMHNIFAGSLVLTQPLYMGGRLKAYDKITNYTKLLLGNERNEALQQTILETDQAYWQVVSLANKKELAESYVKMLQKIDGDIQKMYTQGVATKANTLTVRVKLNEAELTLTKVDNGLSLSRMLLCQICGLPINDKIQLQDEKNKNLSTRPCILQPDTIVAYQNRQDLQMLEQATKISDQNVKLARSLFRPQLGAFGAYTLSNPNVYDGFHNKFGGNVSVGLALHIPLWTWNEGRYHVRAAQAEARASRHLYQDAKEKIDLQLNQAKYKVDEANKQLITAMNNLDKANENLHYADVGFHEGVIATSDLLEAQTAWLEAQTQKIDAQIDIRMTEATLLKALGILDGTNQTIIN